MSRINVDFLNESFMTTTLDCGLEINIYSHPQITNNYAQFNVNVGSNDVCDIAPGIAHFLEHVKFAKEDGDYFDDFAKYLAQANAYTNYQQTSYYFTTNQYFLENLKVLIDMISTPYFTPEVVAKEHSIISQEINMYDQIPQWVLRNEVFKAVSQNNYGHDIAGTISDIDKITPQMLYDVYNQYYVASNMSLEIVTNLEASEVINFVNKHFNLPKGERNNSYYLETNLVNKPEQTIVIDTAQNPIVSYTYKFNHTPEIGLNLDLYTLLSIMQMVVYSDLNQEYLDQELSGSLNQSLEVSVICENDINMINFEMANPDANFTSTIDQLFMLNLEQAQLGLNLLKAKLIKMADNKQTLIDFWHELKAYGIDVNDFYQYIDSITAQEVLNSFNTNLNAWQKATIWVKNDIISI